MNFKFKVAIFILFVQILFSCVDNNLEETSRLEKVPPFHVLDLNSVFSVYLIQDTAYSVRIFGFGQEPENVSLTVKDDKLSIFNHSKRKWLNPETNKVKLYISANQLRLITANATCYFETVNPIISNQFILIMGSKTKLMQGRLDLNCNYFEYWNNHLCGGKLTLTGKVNNLVISTFATMSVDAGSLVSSTASVDNSSKGNCEIFVNDKLDYSIRGTGNIYLHGNPIEIILRERTSSGLLIRL